MAKFWRQASTLVLSFTLATSGAAQSNLARQAAPISAAERQQGAAANAEIAEEYGGAYAGRQSEYVERVGRRIAVQSGLANDPSVFNVTLLNSSADNAFALPGGYVYVTRNLLALMNDEAELAAVLGHEVAHVAARHSAKRQKAASRNSILGTLGQVLVGAVAGNSGIGQLLTRGIGTGSQLATLGFSRAQETQADDLGVRYLTGAGYDPNALSTMLVALAAQSQLTQQLTGSGRSQPAWASTHPDPASRVRRAQQQAAREGRAVDERGRQAFLTAIDGMLYGDDPAQGVVEGRSFIYPPGRIAFTAPQGFTVTNGGRAVTISGNGAQAQFSSGQFDGDLSRYVSSVLAQIGGRNAGGTQVEQTQVNGIPAAYTTVRAQSGQTAVDATVFAFSTARDRAYHFLVLAPAGQGLGSLEPLIASFRTMNAADAAAARPRFLRVVTVRNGDTLDSLAARMAFPTYRLERFQVLNGPSQVTRLNPGDRVKIVTY
jgi:predicted Zn-dependent protease